MTHLRALHRTLWATALLVVAGAHGLAAQARSITASIGTTVNILYPPLTATGTHALDFGVIIPGTTAAIVSPQTNAGGEFRITGTKSRKSIDISFGLPATITSASGASIPLTFNGNYAALCEVDDATGLCVTASYFAWNPVTTPSFHDTPQRYNPGRKTYTYNSYAVYLGGQALPATSQAAGHYTGTVSVQIVIN